MTVGAYWARNLASGGMTCLSLSLRDSGVMPGPGTIFEGTKWRPQ